MDFQIKESPEGDWNTNNGSPKNTSPPSSFKLKNPRKGTETILYRESKPGYEAFKLKNPRKGTETTFD